MQTSHRRTLAEVVFALSELIQLYRAAEDAVTDDWPQHVLESLRVVRDDDPIVISDDESDVDVPPSDTRVMAPVFCLACLSYHTRGDECQETA